MQGLILPQQNGGFSVAWPLKARGRFRPCKRPDGVVSRYWRKNSLFFEIFSRIEIPSSVAYGIRLEAINSRDDVRCMIAFAPKAEVHPRSCYVAEMPIANIDPSK